MHHAPGITTRAASGLRVGCVPELHDIAHPTCGTTDADPGIRVFPAPLVEPNGAHGRKRPPSPRIRQAMHGALSRARIGPDKGAP